MSVINEKRNQAAKAEILARVKNALAKSQDGPAPEPPRNYRLVGENPPGSEPVLEIMTKALEDYKAKVIHCSESDLAKVITEQMQGFNRAVLPHGLNPEWVKAVENAGVEAKLDCPGSEGMLSKIELDSCDVVLTASRCGIAISGTIVLDGEPDQGRRAISLIPDSHICVLRAEDVYEVVPEAVAVLSQHPTRPVTWFAGPSATSDIELRRVDGVHGPRNLTVLIVK